MILGGENMIKTTQFLIDELKDYKNPKTKIQRMVASDELYPIIQGLYETNKFVNPFNLAEAIYSPSYISFETALSFYELIPERVYQITSATFDKHRRKEYNTSFGTYTYRDIPKAVYPYGIRLISVEKGYTYKIACKEKALLDKLYASSPLANAKDMRYYLLDDLRINTFVLESFDKEFIYSIYSLYNSRNIDIFVNMLKRGKIYDK